MAPFFLITIYTHSTHNSRQHFTLLSSASTACECCLLLMDGCSGRLFKSGADTYQLIEGVMAIYGCWLSACATAMFGVFVNNISSLQTVSVWKLKYQSPGYTEYTGCNRGELSGGFDWNEISLAAHIWPCSWLWLKQRLPGYCQKTKACFTLTI